MRHDDNRPMHEVVAEIGRLTKSMRHELGSYGREVQAAVLADLVSVYIAGWPRHLRNSQWETFLELVDDLTPIAEKYAFERLTSSYLRPGNDRMVMATRTRTLAGLVAGPALDPGPFRPNVRRSAIARSIS